MRKVNVSEVIGKSKLNKFHITVFFIALLVIICNGYSQSVYGTALPTLVADLGFTNAQFGMIGTYTLYAMFVGSLVFGMISDRIGRPKALALGVILYSVGTGMFTFSDTIAEFTIYRIITGFGLAGVVPVAIPIVSEYSPIKNRPTLTSFVTGGVPIGAIITPLIGMAVLPGMGWKPMFAIAFIPLILVVLIFAIIPESMERLVNNVKKDGVVKILAKAAPEFDPQADDEYVTDSGNAGKAKSSLKDLFRDNMARNTVLFWITFICTMFFTYGMSTWLPTMMMQQSGGTITSSLVFVFSYALGSIPAIGFSGVMVSKFGYKRSIVFFTSLAAVMMILLSLSPGNTALTYIMLFLAGSGLYGSTALIYAYIAVSYPNTVRSTGVGFAAGAGRIGGSFAPIVGGLLADSGAPATVSMLVFAGAMVLASMCLLFTKERVDS